VTTLSPTVQAVLDAIKGTYDIDDLKWPTDEQIAAATIRAVANCIVPASSPPKLSDFSSPSVYQWAVDVYAYDDATRRKLFAIADELHPLNTTSTHD
jgi:hypothetical protein